MTSVPRPALFATDAATALDPGRGVPLTVRHAPWTEPLTRPAMANELDAHARLALTNRYVERDGVPVIPVTGELHYSRVPRDQWSERLRLMRAGGVTAVASYVIWSHHQPEPGTPSFDDRLDLAAFVRCAADAGLDVVLRIGPWVHAEVRNGGFPDWVQQAPVAHRTDDPGYLALVEPWFAAIGREVAALCGPASNVIAVQLDNELYDQPGHLVTLKSIARRHGILAPIWTATAWGGADLPVGEVLPLYGGYGDGFWVDADHDWDPTFREHFFFSHTWDDPGIGADLRDHPGIGRQAETPRLPSAAFPAATCELGGGMATAYHRRPLLSGADIAAVAHNKIGNGSGWQGYYMYAGGTNPAPGLAESHDSGYPNDLPEFDYDFHAPLGAAGRLGPAHAALRRQHAFLDAFGATLAPMPSSLPDRRPTGVEDTTTLRWALRSDGRSGWVFLTWQQPHLPLEAVRDVRFEVAFRDGSTLLPHAPIDVPAGTIAHWPVHLELGGIRIDWATASPLTVLAPRAGGAAPTLVVVAEAGIPVELATTATVTSDAPSALRPVAPGILVVDAADVVRCELRSSDGALDLLVLPAATADRAWVLGSGERRRLLVTGDESDALFEGAAGELLVRAGAEPRVRAYDAELGAFADLAFAPIGDGAVGDCGVAGTRPGSGVSVLDAGAPEPGVSPVPAGYGEHHGRASAPTRADVERHATAWRVDLPARRGVRRFLEVDFAGDVARLEVDGVVVADRFWDGTTWTIGLDELAIDPSAPTTVVLRVLPLAHEASVRLPAAAADRRAATDGDLLALDEVRLVEAPLWGEAAATPRT
ncbi:beta-galactosidase [Agromyces sp. MMS24-JH15]|uniref:beta-galactosidase n=1 Tax=Agromyces sp. MMS24-JH15 TaxID=3243765 RepID=UPI0037488993